MKNRQKERVGKLEQRGLSIIIEGSDDGLINSVINKLEEELIKQNINYKTDLDFENNDENVLGETLNLLDTVKAPLSPRSRSLMSIVAAQKRLELVSEAKKANSYCISTKSWLKEVVEHLKKGRGELAGQIAFDCQHIRPDVWVVLSIDSKDLYSRTAAQCGVTVMPTDKKPHEIARDILTLTQYSLTTRNPEITKTQKTKAAESETKNDNDTTTQSHAITDLAAIYYRADKPGLKISSYKNPANKYMVPELNAKVLRAYKLLMDKLATNYLQLISDIKDKSSSKFLFLAENIRPLSFYSTINSELSDPENKVLELLNKRSNISEEILENHNRVVSLIPEVISYSPRNEFDGIPLAIFHIDDASHNDIKSTSDRLSYDDKVKKINNLLISSETRINYLKNIRYQIEMLVDINSLKILQSEMPDSSQIIQTVSPRYGYDIPPEIEATGHGDLYQQSFDLSLELHSLLQGADYIAEAAYACLGGHRVRLVLNLNAYDLYKWSAPKTKQSSILRNDLLNLVSTFHPITASNLEIQKLTDNTPVNSGKKKSS